MQGMALLLAALRATADLLEQGQGYWLSAHLLQAWERQPATRQAWPQGARQTQATSALSPAVQSPLLMGNQLMRVRAQQQAFRVSPSTGPRRCPARPLGKLLSGWQSASCCQCSGALVRRPAVKLEPSPVRAAMSSCQQLSRRQCAGSGAQASSPAGIATGRQADQGYKRPEPSRDAEQPMHDASGNEQHATAGVSGEHGIAWHSKHLPHTLSLKVQLCIVRTAQAASSSRPG